MKWGKEEERGDCDEAALLVESGIRVLANNVMHAQMNKTKGTKGRRGKRLDEYCTL